MFSIWTKPKGIRRKYIVQPTGFGAYSSTCIHRINKCAGTVRMNELSSPWSKTDHTINVYNRIYAVFKSDFVIEPYLYLVKKPQYRQAISKVRCSSHTLAIESGRHTNPRTPVADRKCLICDVIEDKLHFLLNCKIKVTETIFWIKLNKHTKNLHLWMMSRNLPF